MRIANKELGTYYYDCSHTMNYIFTSFRVPLVLHNRVRSAVQHRLPRRAAVGGCPVAPPGGAERRRRRAVAGGGGCGGGRVRPVGEHAGAVGSGPPPADLPEDRFAHETHGRLRLRPVLSTGAENRCREPVLRTGADR